MKLEKYELITLNDNKEYIVVDIVEIESIKYAFLLEAKNLKIFKVLKIKDNDTLELVEDQSLLGKISVQTLKNLYQEIKDNKEKKKITNL